MSERREALARIISCARQGWEPEGQTGILKRDYSASLPSPPTDTDRAWAGRILALDTEPLTKWSDNLHIVKVADAASSAAQARAGDRIDRGLALLAELEAKGYEVRALSLGAAEET